MLLGLLPVPHCRAEASQHGSCPELLEGELAGHPILALGTQGPSMPPLGAAGTAQEQSWARSHRGEISSSPQPGPSPLGRQRRRMLSPRSAGAQARSCPEVTPQRSPSHPRARPARLYGSSASPWPLVINARGICRPGHA